jgi:hypothetical protein
MEDTGENKVAEGAVKEEGAKAEAISIKVKDQSGGEVRRGLKTSDQWFCTSLRRCHEVIR